MGRRPHQTTGDLNLKSFPIHWRCRQFGSVPVPAPAPVVDLQVCLQEWVSFCRVRTDLIAASGGCCWKCCLAYFSIFAFPPPPPHLHKSWSWWTFRDDLKTGETPGISLACFHSEQTTGAGSSIRMPMPFPSTALMLLEVSSALGKALKIPSVMQNKIS